MPTDYRIELRAYSATRLVLLHRHQEQAFPAAGPSPDFADLAFLQLPRNQMLALVLDDQQTPVM